MKNLIIFIAAGMGYALVPEFAVNVINQENLKGYIMVIFIITPILMCLGWLVSSVFDKVDHKRITNIIYYLLFGFGGLMFEWFLLGNSPSGNPNAVQFAMFFYWTGLYMIPRILTNSNPTVGHLKARLIKFYAVFSGFHLIFSLVIGSAQNAFLVPILWTIVYTWLNIFYIIPYIFRKQ